MAGNKKAAVLAAAFFCFGSVLLQPDSDEPKNN